MISLLLLHPDRDLRSKLSFSIESSIRVQIDELDHCKDYRPAGKSWNLIIVAEAAAGDAAEFEFFREKTANIPCLFISDKEQRHFAPDLQVVGVIQSDKILTNLLKWLEQWAQSLPAAPANTPSAATPLPTPPPTTSSAFCRIRTSILLGVYPLEGDLYIKLSEQKFIKLFKEGDAFEASDFKKYTENKKIEFLFIKREETRDFLEKFRKDLEKTVGKTPIPFQDSVNKGLEAMEVIQEMGMRLGFTPEVQLLAKTQVKMAVKTLGRSPRLSEILKDLQVKDNQYPSFHSLSTGYIACGIASLINWGSETTFQKLTLASMLHDIVLNDPKLAECESVEEAEAKGFDYAAITAFKTHPQKSAEIARQFTEVPPDVDQIIAQHHEKPDGSGFPRGLTHTYLSPLTCIFIIAHDLARIQYESQGLSPESIKTYVPDALTRYPSSQFKKILTALDKMQSVL